MKALLVALVVGGAVLVLLGAIDVSEKTQTIIASLAVFFYLASVIGGLEKRIDKLETRIFRDLGPSDD